MAINTITPSRRHPPLQAYPAAGNPSSTDKNMIGVCTQNMTRLNAARSSPTKPATPADVLDAFKCKLTPEFSGRAPRPKRTIDDSDTC
jgi:hypothetical protein